MTDALLTWLGSDLLHSSLLIGGLWLADRAGALRRLSGSTQEALWRLALLGGLLSASLTLLPRTPPAPAPTAALAAVPAVTMYDRVPSLPPAAVAPAAAVARPAAQVGELSLAPWVPQTHDLAVALLLAWLAGALLLGAGLALQWTWLRHQVARLPELADRRWQRLAAELACDAGVPAPALRTLSWSTRCWTPPSTRSLSAVSGPWCIRTAVATIAGQAG